MSKTINLNISGMHCRSCKTLIETELKGLKGVKSASVDHQEGKAIINFEEAETSLDDIRKTITDLSYKLSDKKTIKTRASLIKRLIIIVTLILLFTLGYYLIDALGLLEIMAKLNEGQVSYPLIFLIGILASFHCVGMCGGLIVSYSIKKSDNNKPGSRTANLFPHLSYNLGRLISYTIVGAILGGLGSFFGLNPSFSGFVLLVAAVFMMLLGLSLITNHTWLEKLKLKTPDFIARFLFKNKKSAKPKGPFIIGLLTAFMPCGPLQAMQLYALTTGSISGGAIAMGLYAFGTIPLLLGFGSVISYISHTRVKNMMKFSGVVVIFLGLVMFNRGLTNFGIGLNIFIPNDAKGQTGYTVTGDIEEFQTVKMAVTYRGYQPNVLYIKKDIPVRWIISGDEVTGCTNEIIVPEYNIRKSLKSGENIIEFTPTKAGEIKFSCWMKMVWGKFIVTDDGAKPTARQALNETMDIPQGSSCSGSCGGSCGGASTGSCGCGTK